MEKQDFVIFDGSSVYSNCCAYHNPNKGKVHLIPVVHLGTKEYYRNLLQHIGDFPCVYENIVLTSSDDPPQTIYYSFDEGAKALKSEVDQFWDKYHKFIEQFYKTHLSRDLKKMRKQVHKVVNKSDEKIRGILDMSERSFYGIQNIFLTQLYWAELTNLAHQFVAIDYYNDIKIRKNWIHADLNISKELEEKGIDMTELLELILTKPTPELLNIRLNEIQFLLLLINASVEMFELHKVARRRESLALSIIQTVVENYKAIEQLSPDYLIQGRNNLVEKAIYKLFGENQEIFVFFGAVHQIGLERFLLAQDFTFESQKQFEVFSINGAKRE